MTCHQWTDLTGIKTREPGNAVLPDETQDTAHVAVMRMDSGQIR